MGMFDYKNYSSDDAKKLVDDANQLSTFTNVHRILGFIPGGKVLNKLGELTGDLFPNKTNIKIPDGWKELTPSDLGVSDSLLDKSGYFTIESLYTGTAVEGPQAKIFGQYDHTGKLIRINLNFSGTNDLPDVLDYFNLNDHKGKELYEPILAVVKNYAEANGLTGSDVLFSGYSLGAGVTNVIAAERLALADGYFADSDFIAFAVPVIYDNPDVILNYGYENDVVHRAAGDAPNYLEAIKAAGLALLNTDTDYTSSTDNVVLYNDVYASPIWDLSVFSILNIPIGWYAHINGFTTDAISRIAESTFYEYTQKDSTVVVADLTAFKRGTTWIQDDAAHTSNHYGTSAFLIGSKHADLIAGGKNFDYIDAGFGDDTIRAGKGVDHVDGGEGADEIRIEGRSKDWNVFKMEDDTLFFVDKDGYNLVEAENVESVSFNSELMSRIHNYTITDTGLENNQPIRKWFSKYDVQFSEHTEGTEQDDTLTGEVVFAREGNDSINGTHTDDILHAGRGDDVILALAGNDRVYGGLGDDILDGGVGDDILVGGLGNDTFVIKDFIGSDIIADFNNDVGYKDTLQFSSALFKDITELAANTLQKGVDTLVSISHSDYLTIQNSMVEDVLGSSVIV